MPRTIKLLYVLEICYYAWFWLGIWVLYYMKFGGFAAVGLLETVMIVSVLLFELPTGAIGDLLGKKKTLFLAYLFAGIAHLWTGFATSIFHLIGALILLNFGGALRSGTFEALAYDTLKENGKETLYRKVVSRLTAIRLLTLSVVGVIGGFLYAENNSLPYLLVGLVNLSGLFFIPFLAEPKIDTEKFTLKNYLKQNFYGAKQLFASAGISAKTVALLSVVLVTLITYEGLNDMLAVGFGFTEVQLGILASIVSLVGAASSVIAEKMHKKVPEYFLYFGAAGILLVSLLVSPFVGLVLGGVTILLRNIVTPVIENETSAIINQFIDSKYRATALSTFAMLKSLPYAAIIYLVGVSADVFPVSSVAAVLGGFLLFALGFNARVFLLKKKEVQD